MTERIRGRRLQELRTTYFNRFPFCQCKDSSCPHTQYGKHTAFAEELDHIIPLHQGGTESWSNYQGLCKPCHEYKSVTERGHKAKPQQPAGLDWI